MARGRFKVVKWRIYKIFKKKSIKTVDQTSYQCYTIEDRQQVDL